MATVTSVRTKDTFAKGNTDRVREILSWYESDNPGVKTNLARLLNAGRLGGTGKFVILPVDQGFEHGPARSFAVNPPAYDPNYHFELALSAGCNAFAAPLGFIESAAARHAGEIPLILKINNHDVLHDEKDPLPSVTASVADALRLGCVAIGFTIYPGSAQAQIMYQELREAAEEAKSVGLAVVVWSYPRGSSLSKQEKPRSTSRPTQLTLRPNWVRTSLKSSCPPMSLSSPKPKKHTRQLTSLAQLWRNAFGTSSKLHSTAGALLFSPAGPKRTVMTPFLTKPALSVMAAGSVPSLDETPSNVPVSMH